MKINDYDCFLLFYLCLRDVTNRCRIDVIVYFVLVSLGREREREGGMVVGGRGKKKGGCKGGEGEGGSGRKRSKRWIEIAMGGGEKGRRGKEGGS